MKVLYGRKPGDYEELLTDVEKDFVKATEWAKQHGYTEFRIATLDMAIPPDFTKTLA